MYDHCSVSLDQCNPLCNDSPNALDVGHSFIMCNNVVI